MRATTTNLAYRDPAPAPQPQHAHDELLHHALIVRALGSSFVAEVLEAAHRQISRAPRTAALLANWPGDRAAAALAMRLNGALHAQARRGAIPVLQALYRGEHDDFDGAIGETLALQDAFIADWMGHPPQTNEVARSAALFSALMVAKQHTGLPFELLELGSSGGLNLNLARYAYELGGVAAGARDSTVRIAPDWLGSPPPAATVEMVSARGTDLHPLDPTCEPTRERLLSFIWADQPHRASRLEQALAIAQVHRPKVDRAGAAPWLAERLSADQAPGLCRVVMHSMVLQYLSTEDRATVRTAIAEAGARADATRPLAWISFEWNASRTEVQLLLTLWPDGSTRQLASCHPYGDWIHWQA